MVKPRSDISNALTSCAKIIFDNRINAVDKLSTACYYIAVVSDTAYQSYGVEGSDCTGKPDGNAQRRA
jgi:hypothetical protein